MSVKLITYDLNSPGQDYKKLHETIKSMGAWWHHLDSVWLVDTTLSVHQIVEHIRKASDTNDNLLVLDVAGDARQGWLPQDAWDWINARM